jgi:L-lysine 6-transaminase
MAPDVVAFGKKTQVCGCFATNRVAEVQNHVFQERSRINSTWGGNLTDMVRAQRYFEIIEEERLVENAARVGETLLAGLHELARRFPDTVSNPRGKGLMCAFDITPAEKRQRIIDGVMERGAIVIACGVTSIRLRPSLTFSEKEVCELLSIFEDTLKANL